MNKVEELVDRCSCGQVSNVNSTSSRVRSARDNGGESSGGVSSRCMWNVDVQ